MKKFKKWLLCWLCTLSVVAIPSTAMAAEIWEDPSSMITFKANVTEGFDEDIILKIRNTETDVSVTLILAESVDYTRSAWILKNSPVEIEVIIDDNYVTDLEDSYTFSDVETVNFNVSEKQETDEQEETADSEIPHGEETDAEIDELTGLESADSVWEKFVSTCSALEGNPDFDDYVSWFSAQMIKQAYLKDKETNTEESWDAMTNMERYILYKAYTQPKQELMQGSLDSEEDFLEELLYADEVTLKQIEGGDVILEALENLWRWHYRYYQRTGMFYDFYADYDDEYEGTPLDSSKDSDDSFKSDMDEIRQELSGELSKNEQEEIKEALVENPHGEEKENGLVAWIKGNIITLCILVIVGIALIVTTIIIRRKNLQDT